MTVSVPFGGRSKPLIIHPVGHEITRGARQAWLSRRAFAVIEAVAAGHPRAVGDDTIAARIWGADGAPSPRALATLASRARKGLAEVGVDLVRHGQGYALRREVRR